MKKLTKFLKDALLRMPELKGVDAAAEEARNEIALRAAEVKAIKSAADAERCGEVAGEIQSYVKQVREFGLDFRRPANEFAALVKKTEDEHLAPLDAELKRLKPLLVGWNEKEERRVAEEERRAQAERDRLAAEQEAKERAAAEALQKAQESGSRKDELAAAKLAAAAEKAEEKLGVALRAPEAEVRRVAGVAVKKVLRWEVTDINALVKARPELCRIEPKASAIQAVCVPEVPVPGLRLWWEKDASVGRR